MHCWHALAFLICSTRGELQDLVADPHHEYNRDSVAVCRGGSATKIARNMDI